MAPAEGKEEKFGSSAGRTEAAPPSARTNARVLLVEDNVEFRTSLRQFLSSHFPGLAFVEAGGVEEGLRQARECSPGVVFMDVRLPDGNGLALTRTLCGELPGVCVVVCTGHELPEYDEAAREHGAAHFFSKRRLDLERVYDVVEEAIQARAWQPAPRRP